MIGWLESGARELRSLLLATDFEDGRGLRYVGKAGSGMSDRVREQLLERLEQLETDRAVVACDEKSARFADPEIYVRVRYMELSKNGRLRAPVFEGILQAE